jgi:23S rRNA (uridine2552-2'-O)-methyltransferase
MARSSKRWISERRRDHYCRMARQENFRSRASYKLIQIQEKFRLIRPGDRVLDLGAAPGGWSQVAAGIVGEKGQVVAVDRLKMEPIPGVRVVQGDLLQEGILEKIRSELGKGQADLILSDMAPNTSGIASVDHDRSVELVELVLELAPLLLKPGGGIVLKIFQGSEFKSLSERAFALFELGKVFKPKASSLKSVEVYLVGKDFRAIG